ncbi:hypothetical protein [Deinococcus peraridilitoris]|uniref:Uncharacterized protein n=1 Tax=Deinococcus peraridilitoris (strain DSM 19664 / LMG 22246 / CIP 109416 / KR-200) TaxID=937777 RepID=L0A2G2_DEIPD|nr:hypothetical protein [Deinococcus peraridilitoris]AFZ67382.1 hypothetical protein Deipe_1866 [Deinococcus peraridilitoris DSM 19664]
MSLKAPPGQAARLALQVALGLQSALILYALASLALDPLNAFSLWTAVASGLSALLLGSQRALLRELFLGRGIEEFDERLRRFRALFPWVLGMGAAQLLLLTLLFLADPVRDGAQHPVATLLFIVAGGASLYASLGTFRALARGFTSPQDLGVRAGLQEWLVRNIIAGGVFFLMNLATSLQLEGSWSWPRLLPSALYVVLGVLDVALPFLTRQALGLKRP